MSSLELDSLPAQELEHLLDEAIATAERWEGTLGERGPTPAADAFRALKEGKLSLGSPESTLRILRLDELEQAGVRVEPYIERDMTDPKGWDYALVNLPLLLFPGRGSQYHLVEAAMNAASTRKSGRQPAVHAVFPEAKWRPVLELGGALELALNAGLSWGAELKRVDLNLKELGGELSGRVGNENSLTSHIRVLPFQYQLGRAEIEAQWAGGEAMWRIDSDEAIRDNRRVQFVAVVKVPKEVTRLDITGRAQAQVSFQWLTTQVRHVFQHLSRRLQDLIRGRKGIALQDKGSWRLRLPRE
jgi:hypothetical protein